MNNAIKFGEEFYDYNIIGNNCGIWAKKVLTTGDTGISDLSSMKAAGAFNFAKSLFKRSVGGIIASTVLEVVSNNVPNAIGADMFISNYFENKCELKLIK